MRKRILPILLTLLLVAFIAYLWLNSGFQPPESPAAPPATPTALPARAPEVPPLANDPLKKNILAAGDYLVNQQLANGELPYQVNILAGDRSSTPSNIRLMGGVSALYTVCRVAEDSTYCEAGDRALTHYLPNLLDDPERFKGTCLYSNGACPLGGATATIDAVYKRWQAAGSVTLDDRDLLADALNLGYFIVSMRKSEGGFYHSFDPHPGGTVNPDYHDPTFNGEGAAALLQLYEITGNGFWLEQAREVDDFMLTQPVTEDAGHARALALFARLDELKREDINYAKQIADLIVAGQIRSLNPANSAIVSATKIEALASIAQALALSGEDPSRLDREIKPFIAFVQARQLPANDCNFAPVDSMYKGGIFSACEDPSIRVDGVRHWVDGLTIYLEYRGMAETSR
ncbi:MAG: hypothetical protein DYG85_06575 [Chloroflexi bacterium CFX1]|nr:hypothetical protein [Chloroflexi bacterium CFX1]MCQ3954290.1 hypothetical protein [Chloroflexota bacterium]MDL1918937.1 hypothetical protein [Chloroflexi bacterium CFX5]NUQ58280.1 hypothetical protein [Anaerolineales bacterium]